MNVEDSIFLNLHIQNSKLTIFVLFIHLYILIYFYNTNIFRIICPDEIDTAWTASLWNIMFKVRVEAMMWGAGTALGELPPYFMARAARLSGRPPDEDKEDLIEFEELLKKEQQHETMVTILLLFDCLKVCKN